MAISPWADSAEATSPDGRFVAVMRDASEIRMGAPTSGVLEIRENREGGRVVRQVDGCNPSFVWKSSSDAVAVPWWTRDVMQRLLIVPVSSRPMITVPGEYRVLELHAFDEDVVSGIDSPIHMPARIAVQVQFA
jgi:hypothetical protein